MGRRRRALEVLAACLKGSPPAGCDWMAVFEAANQSLVTPALAGTLRHREIAPDAAQYLAFILERNTRRNERLRAQIAEAAQALNGAGVVPVLLKGGAWLLTVASDATGERIIMDIDVMVADDDMPRALAALAGIGYVVESRPSDLSHHFQAELRRPSDIAMIDLHRRPPGPALFNDPSILAEHCERVRCGSGEVLVPSPTLQALHLIAHDQFQDGDFWLGRFDLRHLVDLATLARSPQGIDFDLLSSLMPGRLARHALATQLVSLHRLLGTAVPAPHLRGRVGAIQFRRRLLQVDVPFLRLPLTLLTVLAEWRNYLAFQRLGRGEDRERQKERPAGRGSARRERWTRLLTLDGSGKL
jgi:hypothetical protein